MSKFLVHIHAGPENPTKAALGYLVAATAAKEGHETALFLAGDRVLLLDEVALSGLEGKGTGNLRNHFDAILCRWRAALRLWHVGQGPRHGRGEP